MGVIYQSCVAEEVYYGVDLRFRHLVMQDIDTKKNHDEYRAQQKEQKGSVNKLLETWIDGLGKMSDDARERAMHDPQSAVRNYHMQLMSSDKGPINPMKPTENIQRLSEITKLRDKVLGIIGGLQIGISNLKQRIWGAAGTCKMKTQGLRVSDEGKILLEVLVIPDRGGEINKVYVTPTVAYASSSNPRFDLDPISKSSYQNAKVWEFTPRELDLLANPEMVWSRYCMANYGRKIE